MRTGAASQVVNPRPRTPAIVIHSMGMPRRWHHGSLDTALGAHPDDVATLALEFVRHGQPWENVAARAASDNHDG